MSSLISFRDKGNFSKIEKFFNSLLKPNYKSVLSKYGEQGVAALRSATPVDSGKTAYSWSYEIIQNGSEIKLQFNNSNVVDGVNIAVILQYGHGTRTGGYVSGRDYINPAIRPVFDSIAQEAWKEVIDT